MSTDIEATFYIYRTDVFLKDEFLIFVNNQDSLTVNIEQAKEFTQDEKNKFLDRANRVAELYKSIEYGTANGLSEKMISTRKLK